MALINDMDVYSLLDDSGVAKIHVSDIDKLERVDAVPVVHSWWEEHSSGWVNCHWCKSSYPKTERFSYVKYCPWCGAIMDGKDDNG